jgi:beta-galactosidase
MLPYHQHSARLKSFLFGVAYYPEHWTCYDRVSDASLMAKAKINVVRMGEFAWDYIEPSKNCFNFSLFDETIAKLSEFNIKTIFCTPTVAPPRWLTSDNNLMLRIDQNGKIMNHGSRQHCCTNNSIFRMESKKITKVLAEHYKDNPNVIGWQIDNEFFCHFHRCYCPSCAEGFQKWLLDKYKNIENLNNSWGTSFWSQSYDRFNTIPLPYPQGLPAHPNPSQELDFYRYISDAIIEFQHEQAEILRKANPNWFLTHNIVDTFIDFWKLKDDLDFLSVDIYPCFRIDKPQWAAKLNELCRSSSGSYIVMELQTGGGGQKNTYMPTPEPGQMRLWAYQSIAHGADGILHFRWRTCRFGAEMYWNGIIDHDNIPKRRYGELCKEGQELSSIGPKLLGTVLDVQAAVLIETDQNCAHATMEQNLSSPADQAMNAYYQLWKRHLPCGFVQSMDNFEGLQVLIVPSLPLMDENLAIKLSDFVSAGGLLVITARSAIRDRKNHAINVSPPAFLREISGIQVEEFGTIEDGDLTFDLLQKNILSGGCYEILSVKNAETIIKWNNRIDKKLSQTFGKPVLCVNKHGDGRVIYIGTYLNDKNADEIFAFILSHSDIKPLANCSCSVEVTCRKNDNNQFLFLLNHSTETQTIEIPCEGIDLITNQKTNKTIQLTPYDVALIQT